MNQDEIIEKLIDIRFYIERSLSKHKVMMIACHNKAISKMNNLLDTLRLRESNRED